MAGSKSSSNGSIIDQLPVDRLVKEVALLGATAAKHSVSRAGGGLENVTQKLSDVAHGNADLATPLAKGVSPVKTGAKLAGKAVKEKVGDATDKVGDATGKVGDVAGGLLGGKSQGKKKGKDGKLKVTNIVETVDVPVSREVAYKAWTEFESFPTFMKKVESVKQEDEEVVTWKAQVFWSHRSWKATILDQVPPERIVWKSEGEKGHVDGAVTFHELAPDLTRVLVSLEYHPQGLFEHTGNLWRAQGRRVRLELKHYRRHVANSVLINQDEVEGWEGEIHDAEVVKRKSSSGNKKPKKRTAAKTASGRTASKSSSAKSTGPKKSASPKKSSTTKQASAATKSTRKKSTSAASSSAAKKTTSSRTTAKKAAPRKSTATKSTAKKTTAKKTAAKKAPARKTAAKKSTSSSGAKKKPASSRS
jgi:uncharacterized membrane protein